ncbi:hypothetical protein [Chromohalobacter nigrandesensis]|uniref:hypothetical protein n=1 Tax=Chromohalobacter nigrandesensis TaxID=119863 RepID=UPI001FF49AAB|nr:hypothetical protein [Chromohalobacter nigrandesensis]MCK0746753.1 hypothetical protein [Chromohalobacter nigrandesensis]
MTLLIAMNMGNVGLIAADKAEVRITPEGATELCHEAASKIVSTGIGVATGCGMVELLTPVKDFLQKQDIHHTDDMVATIISERQRFTARYEGLPGVERALAQTSWVMSYATPGLEQSGPQLRISMFHAPWSDSQLAILGAERSKCFCPGDFTSEEAEELNNTVQNRMVNPSSEIDPKTALYQNTALAVETMAFVARRSRSVSEVCDVAWLAGTDSRIFEDVTAHNLREKFS